MSFLEHVETYEAFDFNAYFKSVTDADVQQSISRERLDHKDLLNLLSDKAQEYLEEMAVKAQQVTRQYFGRTISIYAPIYISDYCSNHCIYCGFNAKTDFKRTKLDMEEIEAEAKAISDQGIRHILVLTGEAPHKTPMSYLVETITVLKKYFASIALEIFPMDEADYRTLIKAGADSITIYQEVYDREIYRDVHPKGKKSDFEDLHPVSYPDSRGFNIDIRIERFQETRDLVNWGVFEP